MQSTHIEPVYAQYFCKNKQNCDRIFIDLDRTPTCTSVYTWRYCPECEKLGFKNKKLKPKMPRSEAQLAHFKKFKEASKKYKNKIALNKTQNINQNLIKKVL